MLSAFQLSCLTKPFLTRTSHCPGGKCFLQAQLGFFILLRSNLHVSPSPQASPATSHTAVSCQPGPSQSLPLSLLFPGTTAVQPTSPFRVFPKLSSNSYCQASLKAFRVSSSLLTSSWLHPTWLMLSIVSRQESGSKAWG